MSRPSAYRACDGLRRRLTSAPGLQAQGVRYALVGTLVAGVYLLTTSFFAEVVGLPFEVALSIGFVFAITVHFTLQRTFVWVHEQGFALPLQRQARRYLAVAGTQYALTGLSTSLLPGALGLTTEVVYLATVAVLTIANFLLFRHVVFRPEAEAQEQAPLETLAPI
jgi:putative flippase GtrA